MISRAFAWVEQERPTYLLGLMRIGFAALIFAQPTKAYLAYRRSGYFFGDVFHLPVLPPAWVPSESTYLALLAFQALAALAATLGVFARKALLAASVAGLYFLCINRLDYHNNRYALYLVALLLSFAPCDRSFSVQTSKLGGSGPVWAIKLLCLQVSLIYLASGFGKLFDPDWRGGQVLHVRYERAIEHLARDDIQLPDFLRTTLTSPGFAELTSKCAIFTELFLAIGLWLRPTRAFALWFGVLFHIGIELGARVEAFSFLMLTAYLAFVVPEQGERELVYDPGSPTAERLARIVKALDWLRRFRRTERTFEPLATKRYYAVDRDGSVHEGFRSLVLLSRGLPLLFPLWGPLWVLSLLWVPRKNLESDVKAA